MKLLAWILLTIACFGQTQILLDLSNSTTTRLGANASFTGFAVDNNGTNKFTTIVSTVATNKTGTLRIQVSSDSTNWWTADSITTTAGKVTSLSVIPQLRYYRVKYTNGTDSVTASYWTIQTTRYTMPSLNTIKTTLVPAESNTNDFYAEKTSSVTRDSINFGFKSLGYQVINNSTDTLYVSPVTDFSSSVTKIYPGRNKIWEKAREYIYVKAGYTATASKAYEVLAW